MLQSTNASPQLCELLKKIQLSDSIKSLARKAGKDIGGDKEIALLLQRLLANSGLLYHGHTFGHSYQGWNLPFV